MFTLITNEKGSLGVKLWEMNVDECSQSLLAKLKALIYL